MPRDASNNIEGMPAEASLSSPLALSAFFSVCCLEADSDLTSHSNFDPIELLSARLDHYLRCIITLSTSLSSLRYAAVGKFLLYAMVSANVL